MPDFIEMTCKSCGGKLQITPEIEDFACMYCGTEFRVKREGGVINLSPLVEEVKKASKFSERTATELAIARLREDISELKEKIELEEDEYSSWKYSQEREFEQIGSPYVMIIIITFIPALFISGLIVLLTSGDSGEAIDTICYRAPLLTVIFMAIIMIALNIINPFDMFGKRRKERIINLLETRKKEHEKIMDDLMKKLVEKENELKKYLDTVSS